MIKIELDSHEAHLMISPLSAAIAVDQLEAAKTTGEESEYASLRAQVRQRVLTQIVDGLVPDTHETMVDMRRAMLADEIEMGCA